MAQRGLVALSTSYLLEEALRVATRVSVLRDGRMALLGAPVAATGPDPLVTAMLRQPAHEAIPPAAAPPRPGGAAVSNRGHGAGPAADLR